VILDPLLDLGRHPVIGHRGAPAHAPENTIPSFDLALEQGVQALELDVRLSADGVPLVFHDVTLDRTTDRTGPIALQTAAALTSADAGARFTEDQGGTFPWRGRAVRIPTLEEVVQRYSTIPLLIELKVAEAGPIVAELLRATGAADRVVVASFLHRALRAFSRPPFRRAASRREIAEHAARAALGVPGRRSGYVLWAVPLRYRSWLPVATRSFITSARRLGTPVHIWTVNDPETARRLWHLGVSGIITNDPAAIPPWRDEPPASPSR
jgi:glycerophosphoryl diester phosphodiesterase